ncbi:MAG: glycosyltransferase family 9 protein, partial [Verrucomicrobiota bacterium]
RATGIIDEIRSIEDAKLAHFFNPKSELDPEWCRFFAEFDVVVSYLFDPDGFFSGNLERAGVETLLIGPFKPKDEEPHRGAAAQLAEPLSQLALFPEEEPLQLEFPPTEQDPSGKFRIGLHPGSGSPSKNWSFESWAKVLTEIQARRDDVEFVITSGEAEYETIESFLTLLENRKLPVTHLSNLTLLEIGAHFAQLDFYLGHDSGISHLAGVTGIRGLLLFGPTNPEVWAPQSKQFEVLRSPDATMAGLSPDEVLSRLEEMKLFTTS